MKTILSFLFLFTSIYVIGQTKKLEVINTKTGKTIYFQEAQRVKLRTESGKKFVEKITFLDNETIMINNISIKADSISSIKNNPKKGAAFKTTVLLTGLGLVASSAVAGAASNESAFALFAAGTGTAVAGSLLQSGNKNYLKMRNSFKIIEQ
jgi:hypothetical protein